MGCRFPPGLRPRPRDPRGERQSPRRRRPLQRDEGRFRRLLPRLGGTVEVRPVFGTWTSPHSFRTTTRTSPSGCRLVKGVAGLVVHDVHGANHMPAGTPLPASGHAARHANVPRTCRAQRRDRRGAQGALQRRTRRSPDHLRRSRFRDQLRDDELRLVFMCCQPAIPAKHVSRSA